MSNFLPGFNHQQINSSSSDYTMIPDSKDPVKHSVANIQQGKDEADADQGFGAADIGFWGSFCLLTNNICGSGMVVIPGIFQTCGWIWTVGAFVVIAIWMAIATLYLTRTIARLHCNQNFDVRVEISGLAKFLFPKWLYHGTVYVFVLNFMAQNISNIVVSSQVMDAMIIQAVGKTCGLQLYPAISQPFSCVSFNANDSNPTDSSFGSNYVISFGYILTMIICIPFGYLNLDDNIYIQFGGLLFVLLCMITWIFQFNDIGFQPSYVPATGSPSSMLSSLSAIIFNYGFVASVPSWLNEKGKSVAARSVIIYAVCTSTLFYLILGYFGGIGIAPSFLANGAGFLQFFYTNLHPIWTMSRICVYIFPCANLMTSIPVFSIIIRYNLLNNKLCSKYVANLFAVVFPWILSLFFYSGNQLNFIINWSSALFFVFINAILPSMLYNAQIDGTWSSETHESFELWLQEMHLQQQHVNNNKQHDMFLSDSEILAQHRDCDGGDFADGMANNVLKNDSRSQSFITGSKSLSPDMNNDGFLAFKLSEQSQQSYHQYQPPLSPQQHQSQLHAKQSQSHPTSYGSVVNGVNSNNNINSYINGNIDGNSNANGNQSNEDDSHQSMPHKLRKKFTLINIDAEKVQ
jgi:hypothetical protein